MEPRRNHASEVTIHHVPFLDLRVHDSGAKQRLLAAVERVLDHGRLVLGPEVEQLETALAQRVGRAHAVGVGSGSTALYLALRALGIGPGDEVITTAMSWVATANAITLTGATPVFADIDDDLNLDPSTIEQHVTSNTRALLPVHYNGRLCAMDDLLALARKHHLAVVEDAAQAFGARDAHGREAGSMGVVSCFSMNPMKVFAACGEAGAILTDDAPLAERLEALRYNGMHERENCHQASMNGRLDTLQAAILIERLRTIDTELATRQALAERYDEALADISAVIALPRRDAGERHAYYTYTIRVRDRDGLQAALTAAGIETKVRHPYLMPQQTAYLEARGAWPRARQRVTEILSLPMHVGLDESDIEAVTTAIRRYYNGS